MVTTTTLPYAARPEPSYKFPLPQLKESPCMKRTTGRGAVLISALKNI